MRIQLLFLGKTRRPEIRALMEDYLGRIRRYEEIEIRELRPDSAASMKGLELRAGGTVILLDAAGKKLTSERFAEWMRSCRDGGQRELIFLCGAAEGFPEGLARRASARISLSPLTFSHELARVVLAEQIYRALALLAGHPYPK
jgi:23S rRNA (pseudouridine1915-N3)-methyltransferase